MKIEETFIMTLKKKATEFKLYNLFFSHYVAVGF